MSLPEGGSGRLSECLEACFKDLAVRFDCQVWLKKFKISGGKCTGVVLANGKRLRQKSLVTNLNAMQLPAMIGEENLPDDFKKNVKRLKPSTS